VHLEHEVIFIHDAERRIRFVSPSVRSVLGYTPEEFAKHRTYQLIHPDDLAEAARVAAALRAEGGSSYSCTLRIRHAAGHYVWCETAGRNVLDGSLRGVVNTLRDVTAQREQAERLQREATQDDLTGLANRRSFLDALDRELARSRGVGVGVLALDLDGFKAVNDRLGHAAGDAVLVACAAGLLGALRAGDWVARFGGDEFALLCIRVRDAAALAALAERLRGAASLATEAASNGLVTVSLGAALSRPSDSREALLAAADRALYEAKSGGRNRLALAVR